MRSGAKRKQKLQEDLPKTLTERNKVLSAEFNSFRKNHQKGFTN